jgi:hypothetical protein
MLMQAQGECMSMRNQRYPYACINKVFLKKTLSTGLELLFIYINIFWLLFYEIQG